MDQAALDRIANTPAMQAAVRAKAEEVADQVRGLNVWVEGIPGDFPVPVKVTDLEGDPAGAAVTLAHPSGLAVQAKHGALTGGAAAAGLEVKG